MNGLTRFRMMSRLWRVGVTLSALVVIALLATVIVGRHGGARSSAIVRVVPTATQPSRISAAAATSAPAAAARAPAPTAAAASAALSSGPASASGSSTTGTILNAPLPPQTVDQKIIRNGSLTITAKDVAGTQNSIWTIASDYGGAVLSSNTSGTNENIRADISFRVPSDRYKEATDRVRGYAVSVQREESSAQDVTEEYVDLQARQRTLEATALQLQTLLGKATTVDDTLKVQAQLNNVQSDLERIKGKINFYDTRTAFSTIAVSILPVPVPITEPVTPVATWSLGHSVREAWNRSVNGLQNVADALITVIVGGWWIEFPLIVAILLLVRRERRRSALVPAAVPVMGNEPNNHAQQ